MEALKTNYNPFSCIFGVRARVFFHVSWGSSAGMEVPRLDAFNAAARGDDLFAWRESEGPIFEVAVTHEANLVTWKRTRGVT